jgi:hypothetical protein
MNDLPSYNEVLQMLSEKARAGSVSAMIALERALRPQSQAQDVDEVIDRILSGEE